MKLKITSIFVTLCAAAAMGGSVSAAGTATLTLTPSSGSYSQGASFTMQVHETGDTVNVVTAKLTYDATKLECTGVGASTAFPNTIVASCSAGVVTISRYAGNDAAGNPATLSGDQVIGSVSFKTIASGSAAVSVAAGSQIASNGVNVWNGVAASANFTITAPQGGKGGGVTITPEVVQPSQPQKQTSFSTPTNKKATTLPAVTDSAATTEQSTSKSAVASVSTVKSSVAAVKAVENKNGMWLVAALLVAIAAGGTYIWRTRREAAAPIAAVAAPVAKKAAAKKSASKRRTASK